MDIISLLDAVQGIARNGLNYAKNPHDIERYTRLLEIVSYTYSKELNLSNLEVKKRLSDELGQITPKVGAVGAIFDRDGHILLMQRKDDQSWCLPCGWVEPYESPQEAVIREVYEETGLKVEPTRLIDVITRRPSAEHGPHTVVSVIYYCKVIGGEVRLSSEGLGLNYWPIEDVKDWHADHSCFASGAYPIWEKHNSLQ